MYQSQYQGQLTFVVPKLLTHIVLTYDIQGYNGGQ